MIITITAILACAVCLLGAARGYRALEWLTAFKARVLGAAMGSLLMILYRPGNDGKKRLLVRFVIGVIVGAVSAPALLYWMSWPETPDLMLFAATVGGSLGVIIVQVLNSQAVLEAIKRRMTK